MPDTPKSPDIRALHPKQWGVVLQVFTSTGRLKHSRSYAVGGDLAPAKGRTVEVSNRGRANKNAKPRGGTVVPYTDPDKANELLALSWGTEAELGQRLAELDYNFPADHLASFLKVSQHNYLQIGVRKPRKADQTALKTLPAFGTLRGKTLTYQRLVLAVKNLAEVYRRNKDLRVQVKGITTRKLYVEGNSNARSGTNRNKTDVELGEELKIARNNLIWAINIVLGKTGRLSIPFEKKLKRAIKSGDAGQALALMETQRTAKEKKDSKSKQDQVQSNSVQPEGESAKGVVKNRRLALQEGVMVGWLKISCSYYNNEDLRVETPDVILTKKGVLPLGSSRSPTYLAPDDTSTTEGYRLFRLEDEKPDPTDVIDPHDYRVQIERDRLLLSEEIKRRAIKNKTPVHAAVFGAPDAGLDKRLADTQRSRKGGIVFAPSLPGAPLTDRRCAIYVFEKDCKWPKTLVADLLGQQVANRRRNTAALAAVSFMAGQLYRNPNLSYAEKAKGLLDKGLSRKLALAFGGTIAVLGVALSGGAVAGLLILAIATVPVKKVIRRKWIDSPAKLLQDKNFTSFYRDEKNLTPDEIQSLEGYAAKGIKGWISNKLRPNSEIEAQAKGLQSFADYVLSAESDVGDLLRRSFVHLRYAEDAMANVTGGTKKEKAEAAGKALYHLEKTWRFMSSSALFLGKAQATHEEAQKNWARKSPVASKILIRTFQKHYDEIDALGKADGIKDLMLDALERNWRAKASYFFDTKARQLKLKADNLRAQDAQDEQMEAFLKHAYPERVDLSQTPHLRERANDLGGPQLFAEWATRGGLLEPYDPFDGKAERSAQDAKRRTTQTARKVKREKNKGINLMADTIYARLEQYHAVLKVVEGSTLSEDDKLRPFTADFVRALDQSPDAKAAWNSEAELEKFSWKPWTATKKVLHGWRDIFHKATRGEILIGAFTSAAELTVGVFSQLGFGELGNAVGLSRPGVRAEQAKLMKGGVSLGFAITQIAAEQGFNGLEDGHRANATYGTNLLGQNARAETMTNEIARNASTPGPEEVGKLVKNVVAKENRGAETAFDNKVMTDLGAYVGGGLMKEIGIAMAKGDQLSKQLDNFVHPSKTKTDTDPLTSFGKWWNEQPPLNKMALEIQPIAEYYGLMDRLDVNMAALLTYLEMLRWRAVLTERRIFEAFEMRDTYDTWDKPASKLPEYDAAFGQGGAT